MKNTFDIYAHIQDKQVKIATAYSKGIAYAIAQKMIEIYLNTADRITVTQGQRVEYTLFTGHIA